jgi:hypothetical protein
MSSHPPIAQADLIEGYTTGGTLWFPQLHLPDPYFAMPILSGVFSVIAARVRAPIAAALLLLSVCGHAFIISACRRTLA